MQSRHSADPGILAVELDAAYVSHHPYWWLWLSLAFVFWAPSSNGEVLLEHEPAVVLQALTEMPDLPRDITLETAEALLNERARLEHLANPDWEEPLLRVLRDHWHSTADDPSGLAEDLAVLARYFSAYPEVRRLLLDLHGLDWTLQYTPATFKTEVRGSRLHVRSVAVHFDPRTAAQFRFQNACSEKRAHCIASPADVLLHELLHAHIILTQPHRFIQQGGMSGAMYPYQHEQQTISHEVRLYQAMSRRDQRSRPLRTEHTGRPILVHCATCVY